MDSKRRYRYFPPWEILVNRMLFDVCFLGLPLSIAICLVVTALRVQELKFWYPAFPLFAYCAFYLFGGREVLLYLTVAVLMGGGYLSAGGVVGAP